MKYIIRVFHDGECKKYNSPFQDSQKITDLYASLSVPIETVGDDKIKDRIKSLGFSGISRWVIINSNFNIITFDL